ncbi:Uncharacterized protein TCM_007241 [Theobroma cacao]|uniref:Uncharacterized protein n=1 Tax=Theobroma cacao TaxID=3641 RepID=A0A061E880_THECC|nr:Uncharacterized protein TCM_007241 [Theobroma cacao]
MKMPMQIKLLPPNKDSVQSPNMITGKSRRNRTRCGTKTTASGFISIAKGMKLLEHSVLHNRYFGWLQIVSVPTPIYILISTFSSLPSAEVREITSSDTQNIPPLERTPKKGGRIPQFETISKKACKLNLPFQEDLLVRKNPIHMHPKRPYPYLQEPMITGCMLQKCHPS